MDAVANAAEICAVAKREGVDISSSKGLDRDAWRRVFVDLADGVSFALETVYDEIGPRLYGLALWRTGSAEDAADVVQDVFVQLAESRPKLKTVRRPEQWLLTLTHRRAIDAVRRRARRRTDPLEKATFVESDRHGGESQVDAQRASRLLAELPETQREAVYLRHFEDCTFKTIGRIVGVSTFTAASRYRLGLIRLRRLMGADDEQ